MFSTRRTLAALTRHSLTRHSLTRATAMRDFVRNSSSMREVVRGSSLRTRVGAFAAAGGIAVVAGLSGPAIAAPATDAAPVLSALPAAQATIEQATAQTPPAPAEQPAPPAPAAPVAPSVGELHPAEVQGTQQSFTPTPEQLANAKAIVEAGKAMGLPPRAWVIAVATAMQESTLNNIGHLGERNDHDSQGLFQQRPSSGWGTPAQITDPTYAATAFYKGLTQVEGWNTMPLTKAAQTVQVSAYPDHYAKWEMHAGNLINALYGTGPYANTPTS